MAEKSKDFKISDESIDILASKIHELEFVDLPYKLLGYRCCQCKVVAIKHRIVNCQHVFCHQCYPIYYGRQCPVCETVITGSTLDDDFTKAVLSFKVFCEFKKNGCQTVVELGDFLSHTKYCRPKLYTDIETLPRDLNAEVNSSDSQDTSFDWTISGVRQKMEKCKKYKDVFAESEEYSIPSHGLKFTAKLGGGYGSSRMRIHLHFTSESSADSPPFLHSRKYVLVDRSNGHEGKQDFVLLDQPRFGRDTEELLEDFLWYVISFPMSFFRDSDKYVKNDEILIRIIFEPIAKMFKRVSSMDGTLLVRIDNYTERKREEVYGIREFLTSEPFYTSDKGYRMDIEINLNALGPMQVKGIRILPVFRIGEWDDSHSFPIKFKYERVLMDQSDAPTKKNIRNNILVGNQTHRNRSYSYFNVDFISHLDVEKFPYLKDDSLLIKIVVEMLD